MLGVGGYCRLFRSGTADEKLYMKTENSTLVLFVLYRLHHGQRIMIDVFLNVEWFLVPVDYYRDMKKRLSGYPRSRRP